MLREIRDVKQYDADQHRRWFRSDFFDLYIWEKAGELTGFQLCYGDHGEQHALRWSEEAGYQHEGIDAPEDKPGRAMSAIFVADGAFDAPTIRDRFHADSTAIAPEIAAFVSAKLLAYTPPQMTI
jgi:hypothetical protein